MVSRRAGIVAPCRRRVPIRHVLENGRVLGLYLVLRRSIASDSHSSSKLSQIARRSPHLNSVVGREVDLAGFGSGDCGYPCLVFVPNGVLPPNSRLSDLVCDEDSVALAKTRLCVVVGSVGRSLLLSLSLSASLADRCAFSFDRFDESRLPHPKLL